MKPRLIKSKHEYLELARAGLVGNCPRTWDSVEEFLAEADDETVGIRITKPGSIKFSPYVPRKELVSSVSMLDLQPGEYYLSEAVLPHNVLLAGELSWHQGEWTFFHSYFQADTRTALKVAGIHLWGSLAVELLIKRYAAPEDWDDLMDLFERYSPGGQYPVIELIITKSPHGIFHRRMLIWEVRHY